MSSIVYATSYTTSYYILTLQENVVNTQIEELTHSGFDTQVDSSQPNVMYVKATANAAVPFYLVNNIKRIQYVNAQGKVINLKKQSTSTPPNFFKIFFSFLI